MYQVFKGVDECGVLPIAIFQNKEQAVPFVEALIDGGMPFLEVLFRTDAAEDCLKEIVKAYPDFLVGAGTILNEEQAARAIDAGAKFIVMPGYDPELVTYILNRNIPVVPGCSTAGEVQQALKKGVLVQKFFPAKAIGGPDLLRELHGPYPDVKFVVTGGIEADDVAEFLECKNVAAAGGLFMYEMDDFVAGNFEAVKNQIAACRERFKRK